MQATRASVSSRSNQAMVVGESLSNTPAHRVCVSAPKHMSIGGTHAQRFRDWGLCAATSAEATIVDVAQHHSSHWDNLSLCRTLCNPIAAPTHTTNARGKPPAESNPMRTHPHIATAHTPAIAPEWIAAARSACSSASG